MAAIQDREQAKEFVLRTVKERDVQFIRLWFTDVSGTLKGFAIMREELEEALNEGFGFDGSSIDGYARSDESDMIALPDPTTFSLLPWRPQERGVARLFCDILLPDGSPFTGDPRYVLKKNLEKAREKGFTFYVGPEMEYFYLKSPDDPTPVDAAGYFDQDSLDLTTDLRRDTVLNLEEMGIGVAYTHHEVAPGQEEIVLRHTDALTMADNCMTYKVVVKEVARQHNVFATFMPKPLANLNGNGMHTHQSLFRGENNVFYDADEDLNLSAIGRHYIAGLLEHASGITSITNQWVNSYKRLVPGYEAPIYISWAKVNRSDLIRVPRIKPSRPDEMRIEYRAPDAACNPYLAFSVMLAAGLDGVERALDPPEPLTQNAYDMSDETRIAKGVNTLPGDLMQAVLATEEDPLVRDTLGDSVFESFLKNKKIEWDTFRRQVTDYELQRYLPVL